MADKIEELALQCGAWHQVYDQKLFMVNKNFDVAKFAELIVRECIEKVELRKKFAIEDEHVMEHAFDLLVYDLESHFGVK